MREYGQPSTGMQVRCKLDVQYSSLYYSFRHKVGARVPATQSPPSVYGTVHEEQFQTKHTEHCKVVLTVLLFELQLDSTMDTNLN